MEPSTSLGAHGQDVAPSTTTSAMGSFHDEKRAPRRVALVPREGPIPSTRALIEALMGEGIEGATRLDIGGCIGAIQHELIDAGVRHATSADAAALTSRWHAGKAGAAVRCGRSSVPAIGRTDRWRERSRTAHFRGRRTGVARRRLPPRVVAKDVTAHSRSTGCHSLPAQAL
jgi:hypothetical protein